jgi:predicted RNase H-related nuclease YkuK (DUF458 family)
MAKFDFDKNPANFEEDDIEEIVNLLLTLSDETKLYFGCDSVRFVKNGKRMARYATVLIVHKKEEGRTLHSGCRIFRHISVEEDIDRDEGKPFNRLMIEAYKVTQLYMQMFHYIFGYDIEIHIDINPDKIHGSSIAAQAAAGFILGSTGIDPKLKPESWAASFGADGVGRGFDVRH